MVFPVMTASLADGLYATLQTTEGDIRIDLQFEEAPRTCANFLSLAEGTRAWVNLENGQPDQSGFYDGITFHRVASNFVIQAGSPSGEGVDGPGYRFSDEFSTTLRHRATGTVSMANSGPNSNGSQFFITLRPTPQLDFDQAPLTSAHSVFGYVTEGLDVVAAIGNVATAPPGDGVPLIDVVITNVGVERVGLAAELFDPDQVTPRLPDVRGVQSSLAFNADLHVEMTWNARRNHLYWIFEATDLMGGRWQSLTPFSVPAQGLLLDVLYTNEVPRHFAVVAVEYFEE